jgi:transketolase
MDMDGFGQSAPGGELFREYGFSVENIFDKAMEVIDA